MAFDNSRYTFNPLNDYFGVVMEQGRVQVDSDWNEWLAELSRRIQAGTLDLMGRAAYPATTPYAFLITASSPSTGNQIAIGPGRMYVDGLLAENHGVTANATWDPALAELSGSPQPPPSAETDTVLYTQQPYFPGASAADISGAGPYLVYLDVWRRPITYLQDPTLVDPAVGVDTTGRLQTVWQVKVTGVGSSVSCSNVDSSVYPPDSAGQLTTGPVSSAPSGPCCITSGTGYTGLENQFYRVQIHQGGALVSGAGAPTYPLPSGSPAATFKWSRDNASVATNDTAIHPAKNSAGASSSQLSVVSMGRDQVLGFTPGNWIEITDDNQELNGQHGELHQIDSIDFSARTITLATAIFTPANYPTDPTTGDLTASRNTRIVRWDQSGKVFEEDGTTVWVDLGANNSTGDIPVPPAGASLILESGIKITFGLSAAAGSFNVGDFWNFAARTADGSIDVLTNAPPLGIHHHYTPLSVVNFSPLSNTDCRTPWPPSGAEECGCCCTATVGEGGKFKKIQKAVDSLPADGGEVCILPGRYFEHVHIRGKRNVVIHGCGWQTRVASPALNSKGAAPADPKEVEDTEAKLGFGAVITLEACQHVVLRDFAIEASGEAGIVVHSEFTTDTGGDAFISEAMHPAIDTTIENLVIAADDHPAIFARGVELLRIDRNRIAMEDVRSQWPAVWVRGKEIHIDRNWVGLQNAANDHEWLPTTVINDDLADLIADAKPSESAESADVGNPIRSQAIKNPGGIQIAGPSSNVYIMENEIEGGSGNGITLGSVEVLVNGQISKTPIGVRVTPDGPCSTGGTLQIPGTITSQQGSEVVAGGLLRNIQIDRNRISDMGLCGIGPVGFFNLLEELEVITIEDLVISSNSISRTVLQTLAQRDAKASTFGYGAISVPDVVDLVIRDNAIIDFGDEPGADVCGIFVLNGEMVEISRNQVLETRDLDRTGQAPDRTGNVRGGIVIYFVTPPSLQEIAGSSTPPPPPAPAPAAGALPKTQVPSPTFSATDAAFLRPTFEPSLPALRIEHNVVRLALGQALTVLGYGPFSIVNNHLSTGGNTTGGELPLERLAATALILNLGIMLEITDLAVLFQDLANQTSAPPPNLSVPAAALSGTVLFTNNICQLEAKVDGQHAISSVLVTTLDHLNFSNNSTWIDGTGIVTVLDVLLLGASIHVGGNRLQEAFTTVGLSGYTAGLMNITAHNISTYCLIVKGPPHLRVNSPNVALIQSFSADICSRLKTVLAGDAAAQTGSAPVGG